MLSAHVRPKESLHHSLCLAVEEWRNLSARAARAGPHRDANDPYPRPSKATALAFRPVRSSETARRERATSSYCWAAVTRHRSRESPRPIVRR